MIKKLPVGFFYDVAAFFTISPRKFFGPLFSARSAEKSAERRKTLSHFFSFLRIFIFFYGLVQLPFSSSFLFMVLVKKILFHSLAYTPLHYTTLRYTTLQR